MMEATYSFTFEFKLNDTVCDISGTFVTQDDKIVSLNATHVNMPSIYAVTADESDTLITTTNIPDNFNDGSLDIANYNVTSGPSYNTFEITDPNLSTTTSLNFDNIFTPNLTQYGILFYLNTEGAGPIFFRLKKVSTTGRSVTLSDTVEIFSAEGTTIVNTTQQFSLTYTPTSPIPTPNPVCMPAGTVVQTDQGWFNIETLNANSHTIDGRRIVAVSKTISPDNRLVLFKKNALGPNVPEMDTYLTPPHKVCVGKEMVDADKVLRRSRNNPLIVSARLNKGEVLYNVLLETYHVMTVNNMLVETLNPIHPIARLYQQQQNTSDAFFANRNDTWF